jgi:predicted HTH domain antitoxin
MEDLIISGEFLEQAKITAKDLKIEIAAYLYAKERLSMGQARKLAGLDLISFQKELAKRDIYIHYDTEDFLSDLKTLEKLDRKQGK